MARSFMCLLDKSFLLEKIHKIKLKVYKYFASVKALLLKS